MANIEQNEDGTWGTGGLKFTSKEAAELFAASREKPRQDSLKSSAPRSAETKLLHKKIFGYLCLALFSMWILSNCSGSKSPATSPSSTKVSQSVALTSCQFALKAMSKDPETAEIPYVENFGSGNEFYFAWGASTKPVRMKNGFGAILSYGASCIVDGTTGKITSISLDGKTMF